MNLSIIIVNYNTKDYLKKLLNSLKPALQGLSTEVFIVDNASSDGSRQMVKKDFSWVKLMALPKNVGFSKANNKALKKAKGDFLLLLNSDTKVFKNTFLKAVKFMKTKPKCGLMTVRVELADGNIDPASHRGLPAPWPALTYFSGLEKLFPKSKLFSQYHQGWKNLTESHQIDSPSGCFFLIRKKTFKKVGFLDERFFMYGEDLDYSLRMKQAGWQIWYYPGTKIIHYKKRSGRANKNKAEQIKATSHFFDTMNLFYQKHFIKNYPKPVRLLIDFAIWGFKNLKILSIKIKDLI
jgi:GT2 family glycosyltransferase